MIAHLITAAITFAAPAELQASPDLGVWAVCAPEIDNSRNRVRYVIGQEDISAAFSQLGVERDPSKFRVLADETDREACLALRTALKDQIEQWKRFDFVFFQAGDRYLVQFIRKRPPVNDGLIHINTGFSPIAILDRNFRLLRVLHV